MNDAPNLRRRVRGLERRLDSAGTLYVVSWLCLTGAAACLVLSFVAALALGWRFWR